MAVSATALSSSLACFCPSSEASSSLCTLRRKPLSVLSMALPATKGPAAASSLCVAGFSANSAMEAGRGRRRALACSTPSAFPYVGRVGWHRREGNASILSSGGGDEANAGKVDEASSSSSSSSENLSAMLPFAVAATAVAALSRPSTFSWMPKEYYAPALGGIMLSIGIKLSLDDFALAFKRYAIAAVCWFLAQYVLKPLLGLLIAKAFGASSMFYAGFILTCCVSGAQLSEHPLDQHYNNLLCHRHPLLTGLLIGDVVPVDAGAMSKSILQVVLLPVTVGLVLNTYAKPVVNILKPIMPFVAMVCTSLCIGSPLAINRNQILSAEGLQLLFPILTFHLAAFTLGYWLSKLPIFRQEEGVCRTISLCTGMQSSTLAGLLATQFLGASHAVPAACSVVAMAVMGLFLAAFWGTGSRLRDLPFPLFFSLVKPPAPACRLESSAPPPLLPSRRWESQCRHSCR
ncbi:unnamed protein product [Spirodela intermedia]|uniref:Uncharacterized protein n=1 Tax=Spirodela intermedia TaxID=51605 RepID=A0A7I8IPN0_SPIIN|nr:unnamed protein product [Spirodela intermedia]CAA6659830.1 unnamed protein product [Spirodela intermedia]